MLAHFVRTRKGGGGGHEKRQRQAHDGEGEPHHKVGGVAFAKEPLEKEKGNFLTHFLKMGIRRGVVQVYRTRERERESEVQNENGNKRISVRERERVAQVLQKKEGCTDALLTYA